MLARCYSLRRNELPDFRARAHALHEPFETPMEILVGVDEDSAFEPVLAALRWCVRLGPGDHVTVLHATPLAPWLRRMDDGDPGWQGRLETEEARAEQLLATADRALASWGVSPQLLRADDGAADALLRVAEEKHAGLIVVGTLGRSERGFLIGSVSQKVKALAHSDVLLVKGVVPLPDQRFRALLAVDGSPGSLAAVRSFSQKLRADDADARVVHALDLPLTVWDAFGDADDVDAAELPPPLREQTDRAIAGALAILRERGLEASIEIRRGRAAEEILHAAERYHPHLIVMGSRGLSGLRALVVGSVTQRVVRHGQASVLVARAPVQRGYA